MTVSTPILKAPAPRRKRWLTVLAGLIVFGLMALVAASVLTGHGLNVRAFGTYVANILRAVRNQPSAAATTGEFRNVIFLHHSVGQNLISQGHLRNYFTSAGYQFWDHDYNYLGGLTDPSGKRLDYNYNVPNDNTDPDGLYNIFTQQTFGLPLNTFSALLQHEVIAFKSCFPASNITSDEQLTQRKTWYLKMRDVMAQHPNRVFVVITQPPLNPAETDAAAARRARAFAEWLISDEFANEHPNIFVYDLYNVLAENDPAAPDYGMLRADYRTGTDSHPNEAANQKIAPELAEFVMQASRTYDAAQ